MPASLIASKRRLGWWKPGAERLAVETASMQEALRGIGHPLHVVDAGKTQALVLGGEATIGGEQSDKALPLLGTAPAVSLSDLGDPSFCDDHKIRYAYVAGAMANGIASVELVVAMAKAGCLGFFGSAGLPPERVSQAIDRLQKELGDQAFGINFIHSPAEAGLEEKLADLLLEKGVHLVEASAFLDLTPAIVRYRLTGIHKDGEGRAVTPNNIVAKISRVEVAEKFLSPAPERMLAELVQAGHLTAEQAELAKQVPLAQDVTVESDSGGHTDNRPLVTLLPTMIALRDRIQAEQKYPRAPRIGAAGGISTPASAAAAFSMGAAYIVTGSVNQSCRESGTSDFVREMLAQAQQADTAMAPAADMFEMGVKVQVLKRGTMFPMRAQKFYDLYRSYPSFDAVPANERARLERSVLKATFDEAWASTRAFFEKRDPTQIPKAEKDPKHKMALVFRGYLGQASKWANSGLPERRVDYQVWCGPAMGAFNEWARGTFLEDWQNRYAGEVAHNILFGAAVQTRINTLRAQAVRLPAEVQRLVPLKAARLEEHLS
jgi:trans-AT polyketide synthase/acyltransferase/oxidoreductase domain-containing protein